MEFSKTQLQSLVITERVASTLSLLGTIFIMFMFTFSPHFRKPINRLVFYASFGNAFMSIGALISRESIRHGPDSAICQFQAFVLQMFLFADAMWTLAMAVNVYLVIFRQFDARDLQRLEKRYLLGCYGLPFVPAFAFLFINDSVRGRMYGNATLWCWISVKWEIVRIACFYAPIWALALVIMTLYLLVGREVWRRRRPLTDFQRPRSLPPGFTNIPLTAHTSAVFEPPEDDIALSYNLSIVDPKVKALPEAYSINLSTRSSAYQPPYSPRLRHSIAQRDSNDSSALRTYIRTSLLFFVILLVTWVPSSLNRVYSLVHSNGAPIYSLSLLSSIVLPLQGFWNAVIFTVIGTRGWKVKKIFS